MAEYSVQFLNDLIKQIGLGTNISRTYPKGHPSLQPVVKRLRLRLKELPIEEDSISLVVLEDIIMIGEERFDSKRVAIVKSLVHRFNQLGIKSITFRSSASEEDINEFFGAMAASPADLSDYGDIVALVRARGITGIQVNKFKVGVISSDGTGQAVDWEGFLESLTTPQKPMSDEEKIKELGGFLSGIGLSGNEPVETQTSKIVSGLERLALLIADQYGDDRWDEYSIVFSRMMSVLSPSIKKNIATYRTENKKLALLFRNLIPTMADEDLIDIITTKAKDKAPEMEDDIVNILKNVTGSRLPGILSTLRVNVPELDFEKIVARLMSEMKTVKGDKAADKFVKKNLETEMRNIFPRLRDESKNERTKAIQELLGFTDRIFKAEDDDLARLLIDRFDSMADAETDIQTFGHIIKAITDIYGKCQELKKDALVQFVSKKFGKHLMRKDAALLDRKKIIIKAIRDIKDENYVPELVSLLWDPGTFGQAREALLAMADFSTPLLVETLKETEDKSVRMKIIDILVRMGKSAIPEVEKLLDASEWYMRRNGIFILGEMKDENAIDRIGAFIQDDSEQVQYEVVTSLIKIGGEQAKDYIRKALQSKFRRVVLLAMENLAQDEIMGKMPELQEWLKSRKGIPNKKEEQLRRDIIKLLGRYGDDSVIDSLLSVLNEKALFKASILLPTKKAALDALVAIGTERAHQALQTSAQHKDDYVAGSAQEILKRLDKKTD